MLTVGFEMRSKLLCGANRKDREYIVTVIMVRVVANLELEGCFARICDWGRGALSGDLKMISGIASIVTVETHRLYEFMR